MTKIFKKELEAQFCSGMSKNAKENAVVVKLYDSSMSDISKLLESEVHTLAGHRIWMEDEYEVLTKKELNKLKKNYDGC